MEVNPVYFKGDLTKCSHEWYFDDIVVGYDKFYYIMEGECVIKVNGVDHIAREGQLFFLPCNSTQSLYTDSMVKKYWFHCNLPCGDKDVTELLRLPYFINVEDVAQVEQMFKSILSKERNPSLTAKLDQKAEILNLLSFYIGMSENCNLNVSEDSRISFVISYIEKHLAEDIKLEDLSILLHFHPNYFIRFFKERTGLSPKAYINNLRIAAARQMLLDESVSIQDVGTRTGYNNSHYFSRYFKKKTGLTPSEYQMIAIEKHTSRGVAHIKRPLRPTT